MNNREAQLRAIQESEERVQDHMNRWLSNPEFAAALHAYDHQVRQERRKACGEN